jgi:hypothetical protein
MIPLAPKKKQVFIDIEPHVHAIVTGLVKELDKTAIFTYHFDKPLTNLVSFDIVAKVSAMFAERGWHVTCDDYSGHGYMVFSISEI